ncbi:hypothetical protein PENTCL1PPCAC_7213, partial [Pristionchus entomophagus]
IQLASESHSTFASLHANRLHQSLTYRTPSSHSNHGLLPSCLHECCPRTSSERSATPEDRRSSGDPRGHRIQGRQGDEGSQGERRTLSGSQQSWSGAGSRSDDVGPSGNAAQVVHRRQGRSTEVHAIPYHGAVLHDHGARCGSHRLRHGVREQGRA